MLSISLKTPAAPLFLLLVFVYITAALYFLPGFVNWDANLFAGLLLAPYIGHAEKAKFSLRYLVPLLLSLLLTVLVPVKTMFFLAMLFALMLLVESSIGKLSESLLFLLLLISPVFKYLCGLVDFPVRLWLTGRVAALLSTIGIKAAAAGNQIEMKGYDFSVDPACAGLNMLVISLLICMFLMIYWQRRLNKRLHFIYTGCLLAFTISLNIVCNFFRILLLVVFKIMPGTLLHDLAGIGCLVVYVILPLIMGIRPYLRLLGKDNTTKTEKTIDFYPVVKYPLLHGLILTSLLFAGMHIVSADTLVSAPKNITLPGFKKYTLESGILKFENKDALIYIKPTSFYIPAHDPMICWTGSGYKFKSICKVKEKGIEIYNGVLEKHRDKIYAAWWFDNGDLQTTSHILWRWKSARGNRRFYLVNVNAMNPQKLKKQVDILLINRSCLK